MEKDIKKQLQDELKKYTQDKEKPIPYMESMKNISIWLNAKRG
jgi:hypothetical protein